MTTTDTPAFVPESDIVHVKCGFCKEVHPLSFCQQVELKRQGSKSEKQQLELQAKYGGYYDLEFAFQCRTCDTAKVDTHIGGQMRIRYPDSPKMTFQEFVASVERESNQRVSC